MPPDDPLARLDGPPVFVVGAARSGTTWVFDVLSAHPMVCGVFESGVFDRRLGFGGMLDQPGRWNEERGRHVMPRAQMLEELRAFAGRLLTARVKPHHRYVVDKTPGHVLSLDVLFEIVPEARVIAVIRDGRDVAVSRHAAARTWGEGEWRRFPPPVDTVVAARRWARSVNAVAEAREKLGDRITELRYDVMKADPRGEIARLLAFCGFPFDDAMVEKIYKQTDFDSTARAHDSTGFYRAGRVGDWRRSFTIIDSLVFSALAGRELVANGYGPRRLSWPDRPRLRRVNTDRGES